MSTESSRVKTYRVLRERLRVGNSIRNFGDFIPEAKGFPNLSTLLRTDSIELVWVDKEEFEEWEADQKERDEEDFPSGDEGDLRPSPSPDGKKTTPVVKKKPSTSKKKIAVKKGKVDAKRIAERSV